MTLLISALMLITFIPMIASAIFIVISFYRIGYGSIGKYLSTGFTILILSLLIGFINSISPIKDDNLNLIANISRVIGWSFIALGCLFLWVEVDRNTP